MTARLYDLLAFLVRTAQRQSREGADASDCALLAAEYIVNHYEEPITVEGLAAYASSCAESQIYPSRFRVCIHIAGYATAFHSGAGSHQDSTAVSSRV